MTVATVHHRQADPFRVIGLAICFGLVGAILLPYLLVVLDATGITGDSLAADAFAAATSASGLQTLRNTVMLVFPATIAALTVAAVLAWLNERTDARLGWLSEIMPVLPMFVPPIAGAIGWVFLAAPTAGMINVWARQIAAWFGVEIAGVFNIFSWQGLIVVYALYLTPYAYVSLAAGLRSIDPATEEAARVAGAGAWETMRRVTLPSLGPSIGGALLIVVAMGFALFSLPIVIGTTAGIDVLSVEIVRAMTRTFPADLATAYGYSALLIIIVGGAWLAQRKLSSGLGFATIGGRGVRQDLMSLGPLKWVARAVMLIYLALTSVLPVLGLLTVALQPFWTPNIDLSNLTLQNFEAVLSRGTVGGALRNSVLIGAAVATVGMFVAAAVAFFTLRRRSRLGTAVDGVTKLPAAIPNIVTALAILLAFAGPPFRLGGTFLILFLAYIVVYFPHASVNASAAFLQVGPQLREAASVSGANQGAVFHRVLLPLMLPGLAAGWAFLFVLVAGDVNVAALLAGTRTPVTGFVILDLFGNGTYPLLAALSVMMTALTTIVVTSMLIYTRHLGRRQSG